MAPLRKFKPSNVTQLSAHEPHPVTGASAK
jgi:hypothetical protein